MGEIEFERTHQIGAGQGRNSLVFLCDDPQLGGEAVVKQLSKARLSDPDEFFQEAQLMHASEHRNVVPIRCAFQDQDNVYLVMPYLPDGSLSDLLQDGPVGPGRAVRLFLDVLAGLGCAHAKEVLHLDIKPSNIFFDGQVGRLADFGQSQRLRPDGTADQPILYGAIGPPEWRLGHRLTIASDIYQVGVALFRAVNGEDWYRDAARRGDWTEFLPHVPLRLRRVIGRACALDPADRFASAQEFAEELGQVDIPHDWRVQATPDRTVWTSTPPRRAKLIVESPVNGGRFDVEIFTEGSARRRAHAALWASALTKNQAIRQLNRVFRRLER